VPLSYSWGLPTRAGRSGSGGGASGSSDADSDFLTRRTSPGVLRYFDFNDASQLDGEYGDNYGVVENGSPGSGTIGLDTSVKASGTSSLRFGLAAGGHSAPGGGNNWNWFTNFTDDLQRFGENTEFFFQFKVRLSTEAFEDWAHKFFLCGNGDDGVNLFSSCSDLEICLQHLSNPSGAVTAARAAPVLYNACPGDCGGTFNFHETIGGGADFDYQPNSGAAVCLYSDEPSPACTVFVPNQWMVFQLGVTVGPKITSGGHYWFEDSRVRLWMQDEPGAAENLIIDVTYGVTNLPSSPPGLCAGNGATGDKKYGKIWLLPYTQNSIGAGARAAYVWYDELIIGEQKIPAALA
jgi:hypothetical protein